MSSHWLSNPDTPIELPLRAKNAYRVFLSFACAYFVSYAFRSINAVIAPELISDLHLSNTQLGFLSAAYFFWFWRHTDSSWAGSGSIWATSHRNDPNDVCNCWGIDIFLG